MLESRVLYKRNGNRPSHSGQGNNSSRVVDSSADSKDSSSKNKYMGITIKKGFGWLQFLTMPILSCAIIMVGVYMNAQQAYMLEDKNMFNVPSDEVGQIASDLTIFSLPFSMVATFFTSYIFELFGRKLTIFASFLTTAGLFLYMPYTAPNLNHLIAVRCAIGITMSAPLANPLVPDYVKRSSRGRAIALNGIGFVIGEVFSMGVLFNLTKQMNYNDAFMIAASLILAFSIFFLFSVKDPDMETLRQG